MSKEGSTDSWYLYRAYQFEQEVAAIYAALGDKVEPELVIAGTRLDILVTEQTPTGNQLRIAVECKIYNDPIPTSAIEPFIGVVSLLRERRLIDKAVIVATPGFTKEARERAEANNIELVDIADLNKRVEGITKDVLHEKALLMEKASKIGQEYQEIFVVMPFDKSFDDVYILGIREVAETLGHVVERGDSIEYNQDILSFIQKKIRSCDCVIADTTGRNPNVFYEIGYAHASNIPVILITRSGSNIPIDLRNINHIFYENIVDLRHKLEKRIIATLNKK